MWKNRVEPENLQKGKHGAGTFHAGHQKLQTHTQGICNTYSFLLQQCLQERSSILHYSTLPVLLKIKQ